MNKKVLLIPIAIGILVFIVAELLKKEDSGNKFEMVVPEISKEGNKGMKGFTMYLDNSVSMKGYLDFSSMANGNEANATFIRTLSNFMDNVKSSYQIEPICYCGEDSYDRRSFLKGMENFSIFKGNVTELHKSIISLISAATDSTVSVFVSDMILSYGKQTLLSKGKFYNKQQLEQLGAYVHDAMTDAKDKKLDVLLLQYYSDYNGSYYCNFTENLVQNSFVNTLMKERPYYMLVIGNKEDIKGLCSNDAFPKPSNVYASFDMPVPNKRTSYEISCKEGNVAWIVGNPDPKYAKVTGTIMTNANYGNATSKLEISYSNFEIPGYVNLREDGKLSPKWDDRIFENVELVSDVNTNKQTMHVTLKPHNKLETTSGAWIKLCSDNDWIDNATTDDDTKTTDISKKSFGLSTIVSNINKVYRKKEKLEPETIAELTFNVIIK